MALDILFNLTQVTQLFNVAQIATIGGLGVAIWIMITFGTFAIMSAFSKQDNFVVSTFIGFIVALFLKYLNLVGNSLLTLSLIFFAGAIVFSRAKSGGFPV